MRYLDDDRSPKALRHGLAPCHPGRSGSPRTRQAESRRNKNPPGLCIHEVVIHHLDVAILHSDVAIPRSPTAFESLLSFFLT